MKFILFLAVVVLAVSANNILKDNLDLKLVSSYSSIPQQAFIDNPSLVDDLSSTVSGTFNSEFDQIDKDHRLLVTAWESFYPPYNNTYPNFVIYDVSDGKLNEVSRRNLDLNRGATNSVISTKRKYVATSIVTPLTPFGGNGPNKFTVEIFKYTDAGILDVQPVQVIDMSTLDSNIYTVSIAYNGLAGVSDDGDYLILTYAIGNGSPGVLLGQKLELIKLSSDLTSYTSVAKVDTAPTDKPLFYSFPQGVKMWKVSDNKYALISATNSWNFFNPLGVTAQVNYYIFNKVTYELSLSDSIFVNQYIQGYDIDEVNGYVAVITNEASDNECVRQDCRLPFDNDAADKNYELRVYRLCDGSIEYIGGVDLNADGIQVSFSNNGKYLAVTSASLINSDVFFSASNPLGPLSNRYGPADLKVYKFDNGEIKMLTSSSTSPLSFGLTWSEDDKCLSVSGMPTFRQISYSSLFGTQFRSIGQKSDQLYSIKGSDCKF